MPSNFCFIIERELAGMERPGTHGSLTDDLLFLWKEGIRGIVSLTEEPLDQGLMRHFGFRYLHLPVPDFSAPSIQQVREFLRFFEEACGQGVPLVVHCAAGKGRTGTMLACALVARGMSAGEAIARVRSLRPCSIETLDQEELIGFFEAISRRKRDGKKGSQDL